MNKWNMLVVNEKLSQSVCLAPTPEKIEEYELYKKHFNELYEEIERLNNIINECAEDILKEIQENHHLSCGVALTIRQKLIDYREIKGDGSKVMNNEVLNDLLYVLQQIDGYLNKGWTIDLNFTDIREKYKKDIEDYENWD